MFWFEIFLFYVVIRFCFVFVKVIIYDVLNEEFLGKKYSLEEVIVWCKYIFEIVKEKLKGKFWSFENLFFL